MAQFRRALVGSTLTALMAGALLTGCSDDNDADTASVTTTVPPATQTTMAPTTSAENDEDKVTPQAAQQLCDMISPEIDNWRDQGSTVAKVTFNGTVQNWAARNDGLNDEVLRDKTLVDTVTTRTCPDVRQQALEVLEVDDLASALVGDR
ncbi:hypothetical protein [Nocardia mangyaensis]|uniref:hypothetical protein n=1 Tax=Nocardia mangyaensis TaxID=2213200 RepID=UPI002674A7FE|nr:hypothetical protein [Nocardia mangyaensis]MDO3647747.1 hypothetical protein [Nocardia mangyaensis]